MAGASLLALLDDIASILDDVAAMTKVAAKKTAGVLGDDLALNAQQVSGVQADRELPVVWAVAVGSLKNKTILVPAALAISALLPWLVTPLLMVGGLYLCFEGVEKLAHSFLHRPNEHTAAEPMVGRLPEADPLTLETEKIRGAIRTDFVLSAEIIVIALGTVAGESFLSQVVVLAGVAVLMTVGVYGFVAAIVKLDDLGLLLAGRTGAIAQAVGRGLLLAAPRLMKLLSVVGTAAMFLVGGGILLHGVPPLHHALQQAAESAGAVGALVSVVGNLLAGLLAGSLALAGFMAVQALRTRLSGK
jgi:predicted DNA repair protein MutK